MSKELENLGFEIREEKNEFENAFGRKEIIGHNIWWRCDKSVSFKYSGLIVKFDLFKKTVRFYQHSMNVGSCHLPIEMDLWKLINKQIEELGWLDE